MSEPPHVPLWSPRFEENLEEPHKLMYRPFPSYPTLLQAWDLTNYTLWLLSLLGGGQQPFESPSVRLMWSQFTAYNYSDVAELISDVFPFNSAYEVIGDGASAVCATFLSPGIYKVAVRLAKTPEGGILTLVVGGVAQIVGYDTYQPVPEYNILMIAETVDLTNAGQTTISIGITGKNAESADYRLTLSEVVLTRIQTV